MGRQLFWKFNKRDNLVIFFYTKQGNKAPLKIKVKASDEPALRQVAKSLGVAWEVLHASLPFDLPLSEYMHIPTFNKMKRTKTPSRLFNIYIIKHLLHSA